MYSFAKDNLVHTSAEFLSGQLHFRREIGNIVSLH